MAISTNQKPTIYRNLYEKTALQLDKYKSKSSEVSWIMYTGDLLICAFLDLREFVIMGKSWDRE